MLATRHVQALRTHDLHSIRYEFKAVYLGQLDDSLNLTLLLPAIFSRLFSQQNLIVSGQHHSLDPQMQNYLPLLLFKFVNLLNCLNLGQRIDVRDKFQSPQVEVEKVDTSLSLPDVVTRDQDHGEE